MKKNHIAGIIIFLSLILTLFSYFFYKDVKFFAALLFWIASFLLFNELKNKKLLIVLSILAIFALIICIFLQFKISYIKLLSINQNMIVLLICVGFLRLIASPKTQKLDILPRGKKAFFQTYIGIHLFGAVINISSMLIIADKLYKKSKLTNAQLITITRAFSTDAFWSMFFVAFAAASTYAPNLKLSIITICGLFLAFLAFLYTAKEIFRKYEIDNFIGYPLNIQTLYIPFLLSILVLFTHYFFKDIKIISLISLFSLIVTFAILLKDGFKKASINLINYIKNDLPHNKSEISLFLVAGFFGMSISALFEGFNIVFPFEIYDYKVASGLLAIFLLLGTIGIHPIISIAMVGNLLQNADHTLLALTFLMAWSLNATNSPFSGVNLTISSRYNVDGMSIFKLNVYFTLIFYFICVFVLFLVSKLLGIS